MNTTAQRNQKIEIRDEHTMKWLCHALLVTMIVLVPLSVSSAGWNPLADTGQSLCYDTNGIEFPCPQVGEPLYGQDGHYQGVASSYQKNGNQTITDHNTGLTWVTSNMAIQRTWQDALSYCDALVYSGQSDWRLPGKFELESIVDYGRSYPALHQSMSCESSFYWSATPHVTNPAYAWSVFCMDGADHWVHTSNTYYVRCVRGGIFYSSSVSAVGPYSAGSTTIIDEGTGLEWQKNDGGTLHTWQNALEYCENLSLKAKTDWRLPNIRELKSLVDYSRYYPAIDPAVPCHSSSYWAATTVADDTHRSAWSVFFGNGDDIWEIKTKSYHVRCVRDGLLSK